MPEHLTQNFGYRFGVTSFAGPRNLVTMNHRPLEVQP